MTDLRGAGRALIEAATPSVYRSNAFRVTGLPVDATARDLSRELQKASILERLGETVRGSSGPLPLTPPPTSDDVRDAMQRLRDPERRLIEELFWFWPQQLGQSSKDDALQALVVGDMVSSTRIWIERARNPGDAGVAIHNLAVLAHAIALDSEYALVGGETSATMVEQREKSWRPALDRWVAFAAHAAFWQRVNERIRQFDDPRLTGATALELRSALPMAIVSIMARLAVRAAEAGNRRETTRLMDLLLQSGFERPVVDEALQLVILPVRERVALFCQSAACDTAESKGAGAAIARRLLEQALPVVAILDRLLPTENAIRDGAHDEVALRAVNCLAVYAGESENWKAVQEVHEFARRLAASPSVRQRLDRSAQAIENNLLYGTCWFCQKNAADNMTAVSVPMYGNVTRTPQVLGLAGTQIGWQKFTVTIPRCRGCESAHRRTVTLRNGGLVIGLVAGVIGCANFMDQSDANTGACLVVVGAGTAIGALVGRLAGLVRTPTETAPLSINAQFPAIQEMLKQGWSIGEKPSGVQ